jgi:hypothetical protein
VAIQELRLGVSLPDTVRQQDKITNPEQPLNWSALSIIIPNSIPC